VSFLSQPITIQSLFLKDRTIAGITVNVVIRESTNDTLTITRQPVQQGASITDHAYSEPTQLTMDAYFAANLGNSLSKIYAQMLTLQQSRTPFDVVTPKRIYHQMLFSVLRLNTDKTTENVLSLSMTFQQVIIVSVSTTTVPRANQKNAGATGGTQPAGRKNASILSNILGGT
jgi:hypothetical protein